MFEVRELLGGQGRQMIQSVSETLTHLLRNSKMFVCGSENPPLRFDSMHIHCNPGHFSDDVRLALSRSLCLCLYLGLFLRRL